ncbi:hypothetical protein K435DRAFT_824213 [Dendrothele bispora CBS 962.96]|uniref:EthD domain-containing protein n=1 Tax=Dendrothele bispora (strain CBS 962.96) TaxID=1314807 RepID=A0A4S8KQI3_DENBC|nr:hypothetical protein K435DRAFT_824213 [Dendrothele bispora CBS 962.96]
MAPGFLIVYSEPGKEVTLEEFQDWYDNEHVPLRLNHLTSFLSGARYSASDSKVPGCVALYDIDDTATFSHESYTRLRANCSPREAALVKRLDILDRRTCEAHTDSGESTLTSSLKYAICDKAVREWVESLVASMKGNSEWIRTRTFRVIDSLKTVQGLGIPEGPEGQKVPIYFAVSEFLTSTSAESYSEAVATTLSNSPKIAIEEIRNWDLYRAYPGVGQDNLPVESA